PPSLLSRARKPPPPPSLFSFVLKTTGPQRLTVRIGILTDSHFFLTRLRFVGFRRTVGTRHSKLIIRHSAMGGRHEPQGAWHRGYHRLLSPRHRSRPRQDPLQHSPPRYHPLRPRPRVDPPGRS